MSTWAARLVLRIARTATTFAAAALTTPLRPLLLPPLPSLLLLHLQSVSRPPPFPGVNWKAGVARGCTAWRELHSRERARVCPSVLPLLPNCHRRGLWQQQQQCMSMGVGTVTSMASALASRCVPEGLWGTAAGNAANAASAGNAASAADYSTAAAPACSISFAAALVRQEARLQQQQPKSVLFPTSQLQQQQQQQQQKLELQQWTNSSSSSSSSGGSGGGGSSSSSRRSMATRSGMQPEAESEADQEQAQSGAAGGRYGGNTWGRGDGYLDRGRGNPRNPGGRSGRGGRDGRSRDLHRDRGSSRDDNSGSSRDDYRGSSRDDYRGSSREDYIVSSSRDDYRGSSRDDYRGSSRDDYGSSIKDDYRGSSRDVYRGSSRDDYRESSRDDYRGSSRDDYSSSSRDDYRGGSRDNYRGSSRDEHRGRSKDDYSSSSRDDYRDRGSSRYSSREPDRAQRQQQRPKHQQAQHQEQWQKRWQPGDVQRSPVSVLPEGAAAAAAGKGLGLAGAGTRWVEPARSGAESRSGGGGGDGGSGSEWFLAAEGTTWEGLGLEPSVCAALEACGLQRPSAIQAAAVPQLLRGGDVVVAAETGSGKTHAYLAAIAQHAATAFGTAEEGPEGLQRSWDVGNWSASRATGKNVEEPSGSPARSRGGSGGGGSVGGAGGGVGLAATPLSPPLPLHGRVHRFALVLCPNAALCRQVMEMALKLRRPGTNQPLLTVEAVVGGQGWPTHPPQLVVATPAALINHLFAADPRRMRRNAFVRDVAMVVVDEADMLLSGGYERPVARLLGLFRLEEKQRARERQEQQRQENGARAAHTQQGTEEDEAAAAAAVADRPWTDFRPEEEASGVEGERGPRDEGVKAEENGSGTEDEDEEGDGYALAEAEWATQGTDGGNLQENGRRQGEGGRQPMPLVDGSTDSSSGRSSSGSSGRLSERESRRARRRTYERSKQYVFVAATVPSAGRKSTAEVLRWQFEHATWVSGCHLHRPVPTVDSEWVEVNDEGQAQTLLSVLKGEHVHERGQQQQQQQEDAPSRERVMVFANSVGAVEAIVRLLMRHGIRCVAFHKDVPADDRARGLLWFYGEGDGEAEEVTAATATATRVLVCTDAASRGIDIPLVTHVVQAEFALSAVDYLHRVGRTGRAGQRGRVTSLFTQANADLVAAVRAAMQAGHPVDSAFSRKRSFRKKLRKYGTARQQSSG